MHAPVITAAQSHLRFLACLLVSLVVFWQAYSEPKHNWDMIGYTAVVLHAQGLSGEELRVAVYEDLAATVPPSSFRRLTTGPYKTDVHASAEALEQQLPFYQIRPLYVAIVWSISYLTSTIGNATVLVGALSAAGLALSVGLFMRSRGVAFYLYPILIFGLKLHELGAYSTPDVLAALLGFWVIVLFQCRRDVALFLLVLLVLVRTDFVILVGLLLGYRLFKGGPMRDYAWFGACFLAYFLVNRIAGNYGHLVIFNFTLIPGKLTGYPEALEVSRDLTDYSAAYARGWEKLVDRSVSLIYPVAGVLIVYDILRRRLSDRFTAMAVVSLGFWALHFLAFPAAFTRHYLLPELILGIYLVLRLVSAFSPEDKLRKDVS